MWEAHRVWGKQGQTEACINLQGQVQARGGPVWTGMGMRAHHKQGETKMPPLFLILIIYSDASPTCRHKRSVIELLQSFFQLLCLFLLHEGLETIELLQDRGGPVSACYAAQKVVHCPRQEGWLVSMRRGWRSTEEVRVGLLIKGIAVIIQYLTLEGSRHAMSVVLLHN